MKVEIPTNKWNFSQLFSSWPKDFYLISFSSFFFSLPLKYTIFYKDLLVLFLDTWVVIFSIPNVSFYGNFTVNFKALKFIDSCIIFTEGDLHTRSDLSDLDLSIL